MAATSGPWMPARPTEPPPRQARAWPDDGVRHTLPGAPGDAYRQRMGILVRLAKVLLILVLVVLTVSLVIGLVRPETGPAEKVVLLALLVGCVVLAAKVSNLADRVQQRLHHRGAIDSA